jgi:hypothetical protein
MSPVLIEVLGWIASVLIVGSYALNLLQKLRSDSTVYQLANIIGGIFFVINTYYHQAFPSMAVNIIWVILAGMALLNKTK